MSNELVVVPDSGMPNLYRVEWSGQGKIPEYLSGLFSTRIAAKKRIMMYEARPKPTPIEYAKQKDITDEEEAELYEAVKQKVEEENNGKKEKTKGKNKG